jgi:hypothetical protein
LCEPGVDRAVESGCEGGNRDPGVEPGGDGAVREVIAGVVCAIREWNRELTARSGK